MLLVTTGFRSSNRWARAAEVEVGEDELGQIVGADGAPSAVRVESNPHRQFGS
jgi:hypothetical protein